MKKAGEHKNRLALLSHRRHGDGRDLYLMDFPLTDILIHPIPQPHLPLLSLSLPALRVIEATSGLTFCCPILALPPRAPVQSRPNSGNAGITSRTSVSPATPSRRKTATGEGTRACKM